MGTTYIVDDHKYDKVQDIPDLGSLVGVKNADGTRSYSGKNADAGKLPKYDDLQAGSTAALVDSSGLHLYSYDGSDWIPC